ncbi:MAG: rRNA maturation RNase YbeY [Spirochaetia bacterium]|nr:rRNA maturation RNase YbeY [Spirochaetia bacterium]
MDLAVKAARVKPKHGFLLYVTVVGDKRIRTLNKEHRRKDKATDVLSFPLYTGEDGFPGTGPEPLGDVVISRDTCRRQAARIGHSTADEFDRLLVHGILHLLGYDHETSAEDERRMQRLEDQILMGMQKSPSAR